MKQLIQQIEAEIATHYPTGSEVTVCGMEREGQGSWVRYFVLTPTGQWANRLMIRYVLLPDVRLFEGLEALLEIEGVDRVLSAQASEDVDGVWVVRCMLPSQDWVGMAMQEKRFNVDMDTGKFNTERE